MANKYVRKSCCPHFIIAFLDGIRWAVNRTFLFRPFWFVAKWKCPKSINQYLYLITLGEVLFWGIFTGFFIRAASTIGGGKDAAESAGGVASILFALTWFLGQRNTLWNFLFGLSFGMMINVQSIHSKTFILITFCFLLFFFFTCLIERGIIFHKYIGRLAIVASMIHGSGYLDQLGSSEDQNERTSGTIATLLAVVIFFTSIDYIRRNYFNLFIISHFVLLPPFVFFCVIHGSSIIVLPFIVTLGELLLRIYYNFALKVKIEKLEVLSANVIRMQFDKKHFTYEAGQYMFICVPAVSCVLHIQI